MHLQNHLGVYTQNCLKKISVCANLSHYLYMKEVTDTPVQFLLLFLNTVLGGKIPTMENTVGRRLGTVRQIFRNVRMPKH